MSEVAFEWKPYPLQLNVQTSFSRRFGTRQLDGTIVPYDWTGVSFELRFGTQRAAAGPTSLTLDTANGDITPAADGVINFLFREARIAPLVADTHYFCDLVTIIGAVPMPFGKGKIIPFYGVRA